ncbi:MAG: MBL fold metallo-hydrolase [Rhodospirillaceae bacterium TMED8]|nr:MBL fold metallo-hydrolase [Magnetovibrio sp.]OUT52030.1 MAG: MBL fold metallo-hydrolase [Rhodospirillaceae bacterium TMED8]|tara:strand:- start:179 stop:967 length:789 start_codon:yes stop_codon:yes gene_type:complete
MQVTILGSGSSTGVPGIGVGWGACDPNNPKNRRLRPSILIEEGDVKVLIDTSPDLREQLLNSQIEHLDAVLFTHAHADHLHGIDDLRGINRAMNAPLNIYADSNTLKIIDERFPYTLVPLPEGANFFYKPTLVAHTLLPDQKYHIAGLNIHTFEQDHGFSKTMGFKIGDFGYTTDVVNLPSQAFDILKGVDTWLVGVFSDTPHATHVHVAKALEWREKIQPKRCIMTHLGPQLDFQILQESLPKGAEPAFDLMSFDIPHIIS